MQIMRVPQLTILIIAIISSYYYVSEAKKGKVHKIRRLPSLDGLDEIIQRSVELGGTVHFTTGAGERAGLHGPGGPQILAGLDVLEYVSKKTAQYEVPLLATTGNPEVVPMMNSIIRDNYLAEGKLAAFRQDIVQFYSNEQRSHAAVLMGKFKREKITANIMIGPLWAQTLLLAESAREAGAIQLAGTANLHQISFLVAICDYVLIGEEIFAAGAYLSQDPFQIATIKAEDVIRLILLVTLILGIILTNLNISLLSDVLVM